VPKRFSFILLFLYLLPIGLLGVLSVSKTEVYPSLLPELHLSAWRLTSNGIASAIGLSVLIGALVSVLGTVVGFVASYAMAGSRYRQYLLWISLIPFATAPVILALELKYFIVRIGLSADVGGVILSQSLVAIPYASVLFSLFWDRERMDYEQVGRTLGARSVQVMWRIHIPAARGMIRLIALQLFLFSWFEYGLTQMIGTGKVVTLPIAVYRFAQEVQIPAAAAACLTLMLPPLWFLIFTKKIRLR
jgi:putative spermidine/putrescine transport system permease protein